MKTNKGITLIALSVTIVVLLVLAGISIRVGKKLIKSSNLENLITNMLLIKTKAKQYVENANFKLGTSKTNIDDAKNELKGNGITDSISTSDYSGIITERKSSGDTNYIFYYELSQGDLDEMGLNDILIEDSGEKYIVEYDIENATVEVYNTVGFTDNDGNTAYSLTDLQKMQDEGNVD